MARHPQRICPVAGLEALCQTISSSQIRCGSCVILFTPATVKKSLDSDLDATFIQSALE